MSPVNETIFLVQYESCECKCGLNETVSNSKQKYYHGECQCECKELDAYGSYKVVLAKTATFINLKKSFSKSFFAFFLSSIFMSMNDFSEVFWLNLMTLWTNAFDYECNEAGKDEGYLDIKDYSCKKLQRLCCTTSFVDTKVTCEKK